MSDTPPNTRRGVVQINEHTVDLPEEEARTLFLAAVALNRRGGPLIMSPHTTIIVNQATQMTITITDGFTDEYDPQAMLKAATRPRSMRTA